MTNYPVADFLIRLKNASLAGKKEVVFDNYKLVTGVAKALEKEKYLESITVNKDKTITVKLAIFAKKPVLENVKIISRPGLRIYANVDELEKMKGPEIYIVSTNKGVMSGRDAIKARVGGELIAKVI